MITLLTLISYDYVKDCTMPGLLSLPFVDAITCCLDVRQKRESEIDSMHGLQMCLLCLQFDKKTHLGQHAILVVVKIFVVGKSRKSVL